MQSLFTQFFRHLDPTSNDPTIPLAAEDWSKLVSLSDGVLEPLCPHPRSREVWAYVANVIQTQPRSLPFVLDLGYGLTLSRDVVGVWRILTCQGTGVRWKGTASTEALAQLLTTSET